MKKERDCGMNYPVYSSSPMMPGMAPMPGMGMPGMAPGMGMPGMGMPGMGMPGMTPEMGMPGMGMPGMTPGMGMPGTPSMSTPMGTTPSSGSILGPTTFTNGTMNINSYDDEISRLEQRINILDRRVTKLENNQTGGGTSTYNSGYQML